MSVSNIADFAQSMSISQVLSELRSRHLSTSGGDIELRTRLAKAIFMQNGVPVPQNGAPRNNTAATSSLLDTVREENLAGEAIFARDTSRGAISKNVRQPPAESTRLVTEGQRPGIQVNRSELLD